MLKMGQMCHCKATLWRIDPATGEIQWAADRGVSTGGLAGFDDGSDIYLYEAGAVNSAGYRVTQWRDDTDFATRMWGAATAGTPAIAEMGDDGKVWVPNMFRLNASDGTTANSATISDSPFGQMKYAPSSGMYIYTSTGATLRLLDTSVSVTATISSVRPFCVRLASSWFICLTTSPTRFMRTYSDSLVQTNSANQPLASATNVLNPCHRESSGKVFVVENNSPSGFGAVNWRQIDVATLTADWTITPLSSYVDPFPAALEADGDMYVAATKDFASSAAGTIVARLSGVDGSTVWSKTYSAPVTSTSASLANSYELLRWDDLLIGCSTNSAALAVGGANGATLFALDYATGDTVWSRSAEGVGVFCQRPRIINDMLYVAGTRGKRAKKPDYVHL
jgi:outer membrane protein assembly factor BamB